MTRQNTGTLFYLTTHIHSSQRPFHMMVSCAVLVAVAVCHELLSRNICQIN